MAYIHHPVAVAELLAEHGFDESTVAAALLHDVVEDAGRASTRSPPASKSSHVAASLVAG